MIYNRITDLHKRDAERRKLGMAKNELEAFIIDAQDRLYQGPYKKASTEPERSNMREKLSEASNWLYEQEETTERKVVWEILLFSSVFRVWLFDVVMMSCWGHVLCNMWELLFCLWLNKLGKLFVDIERQSLRKYAPR